MFSKTRYAPFVVPKLINLRGISEAKWERKRPVWEGDCDRERLPRKKPKTKNDGDGNVAGGNDIDSIVGTENGSKNKEGNIDSGGATGSIGITAIAGTNVG